MTSVKRIAALMIGVVAAGCAPDTFIGMRQAQDAALATPPWGPEAEGLQCRLRPEKRAWQAGEPLAFKVDLRNRGTRIFAFPRSAEVSPREFSVDGRWRRWPTPPVTACRMWPLAPKVEFPGLPVTLPERICGPLPRGRHTLEVAFAFEGIEVVSNPVRVEITASADKTVRSGR